MSSWENTESDELDWDEYDFMDDEDMNQIHTTKDLTNGFCDMMVDMAEIIDDMHEEIKEIRRLLEKES